MLSEMNAYMCADRDDLKAAYLYGAQGRAKPADAIETMMAAVGISREEAEKITEAAPMLLVLTLMLLGVYTDDFTGETSSKPYAGTGSDADIRVLWKSAQIAAPSISPATLQALREYGKGALPAILQKIISGVH